MGIIPTISGRRGGSAPANVTSPDREESPQRLWNFIAGIWTKSIRVYGASVMAGQVLAADNTAGDLVFTSVLPSSGNIQIVNQTASATGTIVTSASGEYFATAYAECLTAGSGGTLSVTFTITDDVGARTITAVASVDLTGTNAGQGAVTLRCSGGGIDYTATVAGAAGSPHYSAYLNVVRLR